MRICRATFTCLLALVLAGPASWLQVVAWSGMAMRYSAESGVAQGLVETFDGSRPCHLCQAASTLQQQDDETPAPAPEELRGLRVEWSSPGRETLLPPDRSIEVAVLGRRLVQEKRERLGQRPDSPPPRAA